MPPVRDAAECFAEDVGSLIMKFCANWFYLERVAIWPRSSTTPIRWAFFAMQYGLVASPPAKKPLQKNSAMATPDGAVLALPDITGLNFSAVITGVTHVHLADTTVV